MIFVQAHKCIQTYCSLPAFFFQISAKNTSSYLLTCLNSQTVVGFAAVLFTHPTVCLSVSHRFPVWATASCPRPVSEQSTSPQPGPPSSRNLSNFRWTSPTPRAPAQPRTTASTPSPSHCSQVATANKGCFVTFFFMRRVKWLFFFSKNV